MPTQQQTVTRQDAGTLPAWWRHLLVAVALLILCSCQALPQAISPQSTTAETVETRDLNAENLIPTASTTSPWGAPNGPPAGCVAQKPNGFNCAVCNERALVGPSDEYLCDGGDFGLPADVRADWTVDGVEQEDTVAHYDTVSGNVIVTPSNRVCIYAPRFAAVRRVESVAAEERRLLVGIAEDDINLARTQKAQPVAKLTQRHAVAIDLGEQPANLFRARQQAGGLEDLLATIDVNSTLAAYAELQIIRTGEVVGSEKVKLERSVQNAVTWSGDQAVQVVIANKQAIAVVGVKQPGIVYENGEPSSPRLRLVKLASTNHALPGEEVEFTLRFDNIGDQEVGNVTIVDNLATRLEYVAQSAKSSVGAGFSAVPNGEGSTLLRWEIKDAVKPAAGGVLQFTCRVR